jgi:hypothetical protein
LLPMRMQNFRPMLASLDEAAWLLGTLQRASEGFGTRVELVRASEQSSIALSVHN